MQETMSTKKIIIIMVENIPVEGHVIDKNNYY